jgi:hypothetical protein
MAVHGNSSGDHISEITNTKQAWLVAQDVEYVSSKCEAQVQTQQNQNDKKNEEVKKKV